MTGDDSVQMREVISLLKQLLDHQQKETAYREQIAQSITSDRPAFKFDREAHERRMEEIEQKADRQRKEDIAFREHLISLLQQLSEALPRVMKRLDEIGGNRR